MRTGGLNWKKESLKLKDEFYTLERFKMIRFNTLKAGALAVLMMMPAVASAQDSSFDLQGLERGEVLINLSATERTEVMQDTLSARLNIEVNNTDRKVVQNEINQAMKKALDLAKTYDTVRHSTQGYNVYQRYEPPRPNEANEERERSWYGQQAIVLESQNRDQLLELAGKIQDMNFTMNGLDYSLSPEKYEEVSDSLMEAALKKLSARADTARQALNKGSSELIKINLDASNPPFQPMMMARAEMASADAGAMAKPSAAPGMTDVTMTVSATAILRP